MRIGVVTTSYPRWPGDPAGNFVGGHVEALRALGHDVEVVAAGDAPERIASGLFYRGGAPDLIEASPLRALVAGAAFTARMTAAVVARARHWDLAIAHWLAPSAIAALPARVPIVAIAHGGDIHTLRRLGLLTPVLLALRARRARLVFVSDELRALACSVVPRLDAIVQPMGLELARFAAIGRAPSDPPAIAVASRVVPIKGIDVAIAAMAHVRMPARLVIAGDGPARAALATHAPGDRIAWLGEVDTIRRDQLLREASVVVVPSRVLRDGRSEGTPMIALEALAAGVPVVASAVGGLRGLAGARLVAPDDPRALAIALERTLADPPDAATLRQAVAHLDWPLVVHRLMAT